ncbi:hypothetical protein Pyn_26320 [Prunus yedoensis var. nudiflora]|uniref:Uncharacterized protein n=1 Tax=Prunus yedoensis var. nudiflora TaxID=2094558 RepID=A0A314ZTF1_PRUYE|nr:hypothetical protein Pyn_26320 [Prunus yedoensis var. nudiflora]
MYDACKLPKGHISVCNIVSDVVAIFLEYHVHQCLTNEFIRAIYPFMCSSKSKVPVWPFLIVSYLAGAYALLPYFVLCRPPPPLVDDESELRRWALNFLESKLTAAVGIF